MIKWENPVLIRFTSEEARGECNPGSDDGGWCYNGHRAGETCIFGSDAILDCTGGNGSQLVGNTVVHDM